MAVGRTQIRLGALTGSLDASGAKIAAGALDVDSLQGSLDALAAAQLRQMGIADATAWYSQDADVLSLATAATLSGSLWAKDNTGAVKAKVMNNGELSGSVLHVGSMGAARQAVVADKDADMVLEFGSAMTNRNIIINAGRAGASGGVVVGLGADADTSAFKVQDLSLADQFVVYGDGDATLTGDLTLGGGDLLDSGGHARLSIPDAGSMLLKSMDGSATLATFADALFTSAQHVTASKGVTIAAPGVAGERSLWVEGTTRLQTDLSVGQDAVIDRDLTVTRNAVITGDLTVNGTTTTIDTDQLSVQDSVIAMGMSGSGIPGPAGDRGLFMSLRGEDSPALVWSEANDRFALCRSATSPSASMGTIALTSDASLSAANVIASGDITLQGGNFILSDAATAFDMRADNAAIQYKQGATLLAKWDASSVANYGMVLSDNVKLYAGGAKNGYLQYAAGSDDLILSASSTTDLVYGVGAGDDHRFKIADVEALIVAGQYIQAEKKVVGPTSNSLLLSSSAGQHARLSATGGEIRFHDGNILGSTWSVDRIKLSSTTAEWNDFETNFGEVSLLNAIVQAKGSALGASKNQFGMTSGVSAGDLLSSGGGASTINMTGTTADGRQKGVNVFVNGQLMHSGSEANRASGVVDYNLVDASLAAVDLKFAFNILADDVVSVVVS